MSNVVNIEEIIRKVEHFHDRPDSANKILDVIDAPGTTTEDVLAIIEYDISITTGILKFCNSSLFGFKRKVDTLKEAAAYLGTAGLKKAVTMSASTEIFSKSLGYGGYEQGLGEMRRHSIASAVISKHLLPYVPSGSPAANSLFTACLLHDIGKIILNEYVGEHYESISRLIEEKEYDFERTEKEVIGMTHAEVGARVLEKWSFPEEMVAAVRYHHKPLEVPGSVLTHFVTLADTVAMIMGYTTAVDALDYKVFPEIYKKYKIKEKDIELIFINAVDEIERAIPFEAFDHKEGEVIP